MPILAAYIPTGVESGITNDNLSLGLHMHAFGGEYGGIEWGLNTPNVPPPYHADIGDPWFTNVVTHHPVTQYPRVLASYDPITFHHDFYDRIHIRPRIIDLGIVTSATEFDIDVWNAFTTPVTLNGISGIPDAVIITAPGAYPFTFAGYQMSTWLAAVSPDGPTLIDGEIIWDFDVIDIGQGVGGERAVAWGFVPNWEKGVKENFSFLTDVMVSRSQAEQRRALRIAPRRRFSAESLADRRERATIDNAIHGWGAQVWKIPVWHDIQQLTAVLPAGSTSIPCVTTYRDFTAPGSALLRGPTPFLTESVEVTAFDASSLTLLHPTLNSWPVGTRLYPMRTLRG